MTLEQWLIIISPVVTAVVGWWISRVLNRADIARNKQTELIQRISDKLSGVIVDLESVKTRTEYHHEEISRFRNLVDRWNSGPAS